MLQLYTQRYTKVVDAKKESAADAIKLGIDLSDQLK